jgi:hypothetical protein
MPFSQKTDRSSVFLNVPFDRSYERLFVALIAALVAIGRKPRCVLELPEQGQGRLTRLLSLIWLCPVSIHDLSRVGQPVRFNMPFELGLAIAFNSYRKSRKFVMLEAKRHRLQITLSDVNGFDPGVHRATVQGVLSCVLSHLGKPSGNPTLAQVRKIYRALSKLVKRLKREHGRDKIFYRPIFNDLVILATEIAEAECLLNR